VPVNEANVQIRKTEFEKAHYDFQNRSNLVDTRAVSNEDFIHAKDDLETAEHTLKQAEFQLAVARDAAGNTPIEQHPLIEEQKTEIRSAYYNLQHCKIYAPYTGYVAQRMVDVGEWVTPQRNMMAVIPIDYMWVDANYKETELTYMRIGQPADVWFDIYGSSVRYPGKVLGIASGSGSVFSLIPPQNATGNWIKIVQRLPVRISIDPEQMKKYPIRLGISAEVDVNITKQDLPFLAQTPPTKPVSETKVFNLSFEEVNRLIDQIVTDNLKQEQKE
jgi:membrane fusion protein, multidrug efflux system